MSALFPVMAPGAAAPAPEPAPIRDPVEAAAEAAATPAEDALLAREAAFDAGFRVRAEREREMNALRDMAFQQMKEDDEFTKKWIALI